MDLIIFLVPFLLFCVMVAKILAKSTGKSSRLKLPPGPKPLPIIGNMHQLLGCSQPFHHLLRDLAKVYGPLMYLKLGENSTVVVTSPEMAKGIYKTHDLLFSSRPSNLPFKFISYNFIDITFSPYGNHWRQLRKICTVELLSTKRIQTFRSIREDEVFKVIKLISLQKGSVVNLSRCIFTLIYAITSRTAFGKIKRHTEKYIEVVKETTYLASEFCLADMYPSVKLLEIMSPMRYKLEGAHRRIDEIAKNILIEHKEKLAQTEDDGAEAKEDLVDALLNIQKQGEFEPQLSDACIKAVIFDMIVGGGETSSIAVEWAFSEMIKNPRIMKRAQDEVRSVFNNEEGNVDESRLQELRYLLAVVKETLRLHPSLPLLLPRLCAEQCEIGGYDIPKSATIIVNAWAMARDPDYWVEAEEFYPERFLDSEVDYKGNDLEYIPFGAGRRICPGISFSQPIIALLLAQLLFHFDWKLPGELKLEELDMTENFSVVIRRQNDLCLIPSPYERSCLNKDN